MQEEKWGRQDEEEKKAWGSRQQIVKAEDCASPRGNVSYVTGSLLDLSGSR